MGRLLTLTLTLLSGFAFAAPPSFVEGSEADRQLITQMLMSPAALDEDVAPAPDLDWENAFGVRYTDLAKRDKFYSANVKPEMAHLTDNSTREVKVRFLAHDLAVADQYWHNAGQVYHGETETGTDRWGRTTSVLRKEDGHWVLILSRVADLRQPLYKHYDAIPKPVTLPAGLLESWAGRYVYEDGSPAGTAIVNGDQLDIHGRSRTYPGIPISATEVLNFDPDDLENYLVFHYGQDEHGALTIEVTGPAGTHPTKLTRSP